MNGKYYSKILKLSLIYIIILIFLKFSLKNKSWFSQKEKEKIKMTISCLSQKTKTKTDNVMSSETTLHLRSYLEKINRLSYACGIQREWGLKKIKSPTLFIRVYY